jgi:hypothetical protein
LTVDKAAAKAGAVANVAVKLTPNTGFHLATDYPIRLTLEPASGVTLPKVKLEAGGRDKAQGDAKTLSEQLIEFGIAATPEKAGTYEIKGVLKFGICEKEACHPKRQPISITVEAN